ncbi:MAG: hypothetical protein KatS3mg111_1067 [Pirellulaceae bacterium]|nr:MAG: hypothetical protein KatS3mg111_1067 [Pirellulaceae bacterium]
MAKKHRFDWHDFWVAPDQQLRLSDRPTKTDLGLSSKEAAREALEEDVEALTEAQQVLYASQSRAVLIVLQGMDAAGKDSTIRHVMGQVNPQGCRVHSFKAPTDAEARRHCLCRPVPHLPELGMMAIFNRSYYEEVFVVRVHPEFLLRQRLPMLDSLDEKRLAAVWQRRYQEIRNFERMLVDNGTMILKFFLHLSPEEQKERLLARLTDPHKNWKFNPQDLKERQRWGDYQRAFEEGIEATSTAQAPWFIIPADRKWYARAVIADIIAGKIEQLDLRYPELTAQEREQLQSYMQQLLSEGQGEATG